MFSPSRQNLLRLRAQDAERSAKRLAKKQRTVDGDDDALQLSKDKEEKEKQKEIAMAIIAKAKEEEEKEQQEKEKQKAIAKEKEEKEQQEKEQQKKDQEWRALHQILKEKKERKERKEKDKARAKEKEKEQAKARAKEKEKENQKENQKEKEREKEKKEQALAFFLQQHEASEARKNKNTPSNDDDDIIDGGASPSRRFFLAKTSYCMWDCTSCITTIKIIYFMMQQTKILCKSCCKNMAMCKTWRCAGGKVGGRQRLKLREKEEQDAHAQRAAYVESLPKWHRKWERKQKKYERKMQLNKEAEAKAFKASAKKLLDFSARYLSSFNVVFVWILQSLLFERRKDQLHLRLHSWQSLSMATMQLFVVLYSLYSLYTHKNRVDELLQDLLNLCMFFFTSLRYYTLYFAGDFLQEDFDTVQWGFIYLCCTYWLCVYIQFGLGMEWKSMCRWIYLDPLNKNSGLWDE